MKVFILSLLLLLVSIQLFAQKKKIEVADTISYNTSIDAVQDTLPNLDIFGNDTPMDLTLKYDIKSFIKDKIKGEYLDAELYIHYNNYTVNKSIRLKARGNNRRQECFFPPIFLNFKTDPIKSTELKGFKKIKLVTHCSSSKMYTTYILKEYLVYKIYNILTNYSFRVKLLNMNYVDTSKKKKSYKKFGILIEPIDLLAKRTGSVEINSAVVRGKDVLEYEADRVALFNYMIGNNDWRIKGGHNMKYLKSLTQISPQVVPVPYDFDYSGFVDTHYSAPQTWCSVQDVNQREYLGYCRDNNENYLKLIKLFVDKKDEIYKTIDTFSYLSERERKSLHNYIESFYDSLKNQKSFLYMLKAECRSIDF